MATGINPINNIKAITKNAVGELTKIGESARNFAKTGCDTFKKSNAVNNISESSFVKNMKAQGVNKDTLIGAGICATTLVLAVDCLKGIFKNTKEVKNK